MQEQNDLKSTQGNQIERSDNNKFSRFEFAAQAIGLLFALLNLPVVYLTGLLARQSRYGDNAMVFNILLPSVIIIDIIFLANFKKPRRIRSVLANIFDIIFWLLAVAMILVFLVRSTRL